MMQQQDEKQKLRYCQYSAKIVIILLNYLYIAKTWAYTNNTDRK